MVPLFFPFLPMHLENGRLGCVNDSCQFPLRDASVKRTFRSVNFGFRIRISEAHGAEARGPTRHTEKPTQSLDPPGIVD